MTDTGRHDPVHNFLMEAHRITNEAQFIIDSLHNVELPAVEQSYQLEAICQILCTIGDAQPTDDVRQTPRCPYPPPLPAAFLPTEYTGKPGCPRYILDIQQVHLLHDLGNSYDIAAAMGVCRPTLYNHLKYRLEFGMQERNKWNQALEIKTGYKHEWVATVASPVLVRDCMQMSVKSGTVPSKFMDTETRTRNFLQWSLLYYSHTTVIL
ncbi:hypothetical protein B0H13DRAFT_1870462 [Mycena leptocephala]|nr:hypothetical protein B0H13DRAFT_1870462 [Mycena leptocephala]